MGDPGIICFEHCPNSKSFCLTLPEVCPKCQAHLGTPETKFKLIPFRVPYPFIKAQQYPCAIVIKPTCGDFLNDYYNSMDLHIGVTTAHGLIVEFDENGLRRHRSMEWQQCLMLHQAPLELQLDWDEKLLEICKTEYSKWTSKTYNESLCNCYSFVLYFLQRLNYAEAASKQLFCETFIVPKTTAAGKYISLYRKLIKQ